MIDQGTKRHIASEAVLAACGYKWGNVNFLAPSYMDDIPNGPNLTGNPCP